MTQSASLILFCILTLANSQGNYDQPVSSRGKPCQWNSDCNWGELCRAPSIDGSPLCLASAVPNGSPCVSHLECAAFRSICNKSRLCSCPSDHQDWTYECVPTLQAPKKPFPETYFPPHYGEKCTFIENGKYVDCALFGLECVDLYYHTGHERCVKPAGLRDFCYTDMDCFAKNPGSECVPLTSSSQLQCACKKGFVPLGKGCTAAGNHIGGILLIWGGTIVGLATFGCIILLILGMVLLCKGWCCCIKERPTHPKVTSVGQLMQKIRWTKPTSEHYYRPLHDHPDNDPYLTRETPSVGIFYDDPPHTSTSMDEINQIGVTNIPEPKIRYSYATKRTFVNI